MKYVLVSHDADPITKAGFCETVAAQHQFIDRYNITRRRLKGRLRYRCNI